MTAVEIGIFGHRAGRALFPTRARVADRGFRRNCRTAKREGPRFVRSSQRPDPGFATAVPLTRVPSSGTHDRRFVQSTAQPGDRMDRFETNLRIPGPTSLPSTVREAGSRQMINHRGPEFASMLERISRRIQPFFGTRNDIIVLTCAGTGGLEAAIVNTLSPGDKVLGISIGAFGDRFAKIAQAYGAEVTKLDVEWGSALTPEALGDALSKAPAGGYKAILITHNETSTGVMNPLAELAAVARESAPQTLLLVDGVSGVGAVPFEQDAWALDVVVSGSQKSWMAAPGLAFASFSDRAWEANTKARMPRFYLDVAKHRDSHRDGQTPWTPALAVMFQLDVALEQMEHEGPETIFARHAACAAAGPRIRPVPRPGGGFADGHLRPPARGPRLEDVQRGAQGPQARCCRRPGQADRTGLPCRPSWLGHPRRDPVGHRSDRGGARQAGVGHQSWRRRGRRRACRHRRARGVGSAGPGHAGANRQRVRLRPGNVIVLQPSIVR
ncbi:MAG: alanine--glyoxylate aminotransferase family protein [Chloroflexi bacterium]|nr:MAG: alanine--glyoxylate aminotransferase family protein [Chloroflexota bacterium]